METERETDFFLPLGTAESNPGVVILEGMEDFTWGRGEKDSHCCEMWTPA